MTSTLFLFPTQPWRDLRVFFDSSTLGMACVLSDVPLVHHSMLECTMTT